MHHTEIRCIMHYSVSFVAVHGQWSEWIDGACSKTCDYGVRKRYRSCEGPYCGGEDCTGVTEYEVECNERPCAGEEYQNVYHNAICAYSCIDSAYTHDSETCFNDHVRV